MRLLSAPRPSTIRCSNAGNFPWPVSSATGTSVAADVVGYSRFMGRDESGTVARLRRNGTMLSTLIHR